jgi:ankyrin repeat protein
VTTNVGVSTQKCSDFYWAYRDNKVDEVKKFLETLTQDEIDGVEPNGSTALHAAAYHGHAKIVRLLLDRGADRAIQNKFECLPFDEAPSDEIRQLFLRI